jgi:hypothetical protein
MVNRLARACFVLVGLAALPACDLDGPRDTIADVTVDAGVWLADAQKISAALPARVGSFVPSEGADPFFTSYSTGPVFGSSCTYADGGRQLVVRVESGNIKARGAAALDAGPGSGAHVRSVHGRPAVVHWNETGRTGEVAFLVARRYLVQVRVVPATSEGEVIRLAEAVDPAPLEALVLDGVSR